MSFALTTEQVRARTKTVTRRVGWASLWPGQHVQAVVKSQGLKKGEKVEPLAVLEIVDVRPEPLLRLIQRGQGDYARRECALEGFPEMDPTEFVAMFLASHRGCGLGTVVTRIEFRYAAPTSATGGGTA